MLTADAVLVWTASGVVLTGIVVGLTVWLVAQGVAARRANAQEAEVALAGVDWLFRFLLRPTAGAKPTQPSVEISVSGANLWVHAVRLSWMPSQPGDGWTVEEAECPPWTPDDALPRQLFSTGRALRFGWPGPNPEQQVQLFTRLRVEWSATEKGPRHWREADAGNLAWQ